MKKLIIAIFLLLGFSVVCLPKSNLPKVKPVDSPLVYYKIDESWEMQQHWLYQLAIALKNNPKAPGIIYYTTSDKHSLKQVKAHIKRAVKFLTQELPAEYRIDKSRLEIESFGKSEIADISIWVGPPRSSNK